MSKIKVNLATSGDSIGKESMSIFESVYNNFGLTNEQAQVLNRESKMLAWGLQRLFREIVMREYNTEVVNGLYSYSSQYKGPREISEQIEIIADNFVLDKTEALEFIKALPELPVGAEGWFAIPKVSAIARNHFPAITDPDEQYRKALRLVQSRLVVDNTLPLENDGEIITAGLKQHPRTLEFLECLESSQRGDILIIAAQYGMSHRNQSANRARETFTYNEFGLDAFAVGCMALTHPKRYVHWRELGTGCPGDIVTLESHGGRSYSSEFYFKKNKGLKFNIREVCIPHVRIGWVSGFIPENLIIRT